MSYTDLRHFFQMFYKQLPGTIQVYQDNYRIYLDEYPEQIELRKDYVNKLKTKSR